MKSSLRFIFSLTWLLAISTMAFAETLPYPPAIGKNRVESFQHYVKAVAPASSSLQIETQLSFTIQQSDLPILSKWVAGTPITISTTTWLWQLPYKITNEKTKEYVFATGLSTVESKNPYNRRLLSVDNTTGKITIVTQGSSNPSVYQPGSAESYRSTAKGNQTGWAPGDYILVVNNGAAITWGYNYVLINLSKKNNNTTPAWKPQP
jgi:hypothetical protein